MQPQTTLAQQPPVNFPRATGEMRATLTRAGQTQNISLEEAEGLLKEHYETYCQRQGFRGKRFARTVRFLTSMEMIGLRAGSKVMFDGAEMERKAA